MMVLNIKNGFTLIEMIAVLIILGIIFSWGFMNFQKFSKRAGLVEAKSALLDNANYLENFYNRNLSYASIAVNNYCGWPALPVTQTSRFDIAFSTVSPVGSKQCQVDRYILRATPNQRYQLREKSFLKMDENKNISVCQSKNQNILCEVF